MSVFDKLSPQQRATAEKVKAAAQRHGIPEDLALAMAMQESTLTQNKASGTGPVGVMMLGKAAAKDMGIKNRFNEDQNIEGGVKYMKTLLKQHGGDVDKALVAYHDGPNSAFFKGGEMSPAAANHIQKVKGYAGMATPSATKSTSQFNIDADDVEPLESEYLHGGAGAAPANAAGRQRDITDVLAAGAGAVAGGKFGADKQSKHRELEQMRIEIANQKLDLARQEAARNAQVKPQNFGSGKDNWAANQYSEPIARTLMRDAPSQEAAGKLAPVLEARHQRAQQMFPGMQQAGPESMLYVPNQVGGGQKVMPAPAPAPVAAPIAPTPKMNFGSAAGHGANIIGGGVAGMQLNDALQRAQSGDYVGGGLSAVSGAGAAMATAPGWKNKLIGGGVAAGAAGLESLYDMIRGSQEKKQAAPAPVQTFDKGGVVKKLLGAAEGPLSAAGNKIAEYAHSVFDPRFDTRVKEQAKLANMRSQVEHTGNQNVPTVSLADYEGYPFITSMSDRTAAGSNLLGVNDVTFKRPVALKGGQDYMFNNPGQVWASAKGPSGMIMRSASAMRDFTGKDPLYLPWRMAPSGGDFAHMTGQAMLAQAEGALGKTQKRALDKQLSSIIPNWQGIDHPDSMDLFAAAPANARKAAKALMDRDFREVGGLGLGEARLAVADPKQVAAPEGGLMNVGRVFTGKPMIAQSGHESYPFGVPGEGLGRLDRELQVYQMLPQDALRRGMSDVMAPNAADLRALQMKPYGGVIDDKLLKSLGY